MLLSASFQRAEEILCSFKDNFKLVGRYNDAVEDVDDLLNLFSRIIV